MELYPRIGVSMDESLTMLQRISRLKRIVFLSTFLAGNLNANAPQDKREKVDLDQSELIKRCRPKVVKSVTPKQKPIQVRKGEKSTRFTPIIAFDIPESGEVANARVKRSSGIRDIDEYALNWVKSIRYDSRPGCPAIQNEADVLIDFQ